MGFRLLLVTAALLAFAMGVIGLAVGPWHQAGTGTSVTSIATGAASTGVTVYREGRRPAIPGVSGTTLSGDSLSLHRLRGHVVVLNVWASWCYACRAEAKDLARLSRETVGKGVRLLGIDTRDSAGAGRSFARKFGVPYPSVSDPKGAVVRALDGLVPVSGVPSTLVIAPDGRVAARKIGRVDYATLRVLVDDVLAERQGVRRP